MGMAPGILLVISWLESSACLAGQYESRMKRPRREGRERLTRLLVVFGSTYVP